MLLFHPLLQENHDEHRCHDKIETIRIEMDQIAEQSTEGCTAYPIDLIKQCYKEIEPAFVNAIGNICSVIDAEGFITHPVDEIDFFAPVSLYLSSMDSP